MCFLTCSCNCTPQITIFFYLLKKKQHCKHSDIRCYAQIGSINDVYVKNIIHVVQKIVYWIKTKKKKKRELLSTSVATPNLIKRQTTYF